MSSPLDKLHDFYQPPPVAWTPKTAGWYALFAIAAALMIWSAVHFSRKWFANHYRREALRELTLLHPSEFCALLKRTALAAWPREKVASLSGAAWLEFLDGAVHDEAFHNAPANQIEELALRPETLSSEDEQALRSTVAAWIRRHRVQT